MTSLPIEVLLRIFVFASPSCFRVKNERGLTYEEQEENYTYKEPEIKDMRDTRRFPYCFADVCQRWRDILQNNPQWWTSIRVFMDVGTPESILSKLRSQIELTKSIQPIHIFILNRDEGVLKEPAAEGELVKEIMSVVSPHMARVKRFAIEATHGNSLPLISSGVFSELGPSCVNLTLACKSYPSIQSFPVPRAPPHLPLGAAHSRISKLNLTLDGPAFLDFCSAAKYWESKILRGPNISLKISHLKTNSGFTERDLVNAVFRIKNITSLSLENVNLPGSEDRDGASQIFKPKELQDVALTAMTSTSILRFFVTEDSGSDGDEDWDGGEDWNGGEDGARHDLLNLKLNNCNLTSPKYPSTSNLILRNMPRNQNYAAAFRDMELDGFNIFDCPNIDDRILDILDADGYRVDSLSIIGKTKITVHRLKKFIKYRAENGCRPPSDGEGEVVPEGFDWKENVYSGFPCVIRRLELSLEEFPLTKEDFQLIQEYMNSGIDCEFRLDRRRKTVRWSDGLEIDGIYLPPDF